MVNLRFSKNIFLLIGFILGIFVLIISSINSVLIITSVNIESNLAVLLIVVSVSFIAGIVLNFLGWYKNNPKLAFIAAILYIIPLVKGPLYYLIPTLVLCIIGSFMVKKNKAGFHFA